jgi:hypothetical protein
MVLVELTCVSHSPGFTGALWARTPMGAANKSNAAPQLQMPSQTQAFMDDLSTFISLRIRGEYAFHAAPATSAARF